MVCFGVKQRHRARLSLLTKFVHAPPHPNPLPRDRGRGEFILWPRALLSIAEMHDNAQPSSPPFDPSSPTLLPSGEGRLESPLSPRERGGSQRNEKGDSGRKWIVIHLRKTQ